MNTSAVATIDPPSIVGSMAERFGMDRRAFEATLRATIMPKDCSNEQVAAFLIVAKQHDLNPFTKEIFAFPSRGGIQAIVSIDGWMRLINSHPQFDGMEFDDHFGGDDGQTLTAITCKIHRKDRAHPVEVTEYMSECCRDTETWKRWPTRMLRHKAAIQAARYAFGFAGIMEPDEVERMVESGPISAEAATITDDRKARCDEAAAQYAPVIEYIKEQLAEAAKQHGIASTDTVIEDEARQEARELERVCLMTVRAEWDKLPAAARCDLWLAPTKGGVFTTKERNQLQNLPRAPEQALEVV